MDLCKNATEFLYHMISREVLCLVKSYGYKNSEKSFGSRVSVQGVVSLGGHFATLCRELDFYEVKKMYYYYSKRKGKYFYTFNHFYSKKSSKRAK